MFFSYHEKWNNKNYPIPYSARMDRIGEICQSRVRKCIVEKLCIVCGIKVTDDKPWAYLYENKWLVEDAGPFHEKCMKLTQNLCPFVNENPDCFRFIQVRWSDLAAVPKEFDG